ncbi:MAG: hypothetical protein LBP79_05710 [Clostridiales bacterium]|jgi:hypothetical protein|nr:hypothetical protein [Clostridiales bacterium]
MIDDEAPGIKAERQREKARKRHITATGIDVECLPGRERKDFFRDDSPKNVVIYVRVSTQTNTFLQLYHGAISVYKAA